MFKVKPGIYKITNIANGKVYVGSSKTVRYRVNEHFNQLEKGEHPNRYLQASYDKWGKENFVPDVIEYVEDVDNLKLREQHWIDTLETCNPEVGFNLIPSSNTGYSEASPELRRLLSEKLSGENNPMYGKRHTPEANQKNREAVQRYHWTKVGAKCDLPIKKEPWRPSEEHKQILRQKLTGIKRSEETKEKLRQARLGTKLTEEHKKLLSEKQSGQRNANAKLTDEQVIEIFHLLHDEGVNYKVIMERYNISTSAVYNIKNGNHSTIRRYLDGREQVSGNKKR